MTLSGMTRPCRTHSDRVSLLASRTRSPDTTAFPATFRNLSTSSSGSTSNIGTARRSATKSATRTVRSPVPTLPGPPPLPRGPPRSVARPVTSTGLHTPPLSGHPVRPSAYDRPFPLDSTGKVQEAERVRRLAKGLCPYCGGTHSLDNCPRRNPTSRPAPSTYARVALPHANSVSFTVGGDEDFYGSYSGNE